MLKMLEPVLKAHEELDQYRINGISPNADRIYQLVLAITSDNKAARNAQAEVLLQQIPL